MAKGCCSQHVTDLGHAWGEDEVSLHHSKGFIWTDISELKTGKA